MPTIAVLVLHANAGEVGALQSVEFGVAALLAIFFGVVVDRFSRRPIMLLANAIRALSIGSLAGAFVFHRLTLTQFFICAAVTAAANVLFDTAFGAFLPAFLGRNKFGAGNAKMTMTASAAEAIGNSTCGLIVQFLGAPLALVLNCAGYAASTVSLVRMRVCERVESPNRARGVRAFACEFREGLEIVWSTRVLRAIALTSCTAYFGGAMVMAVFAIYAYNVLKLSPVSFGMVMGFGNLGLLGGLAAKPLAARIGPRTTLACATALSGAAKLIFLFAPSPLLAILAGRLLLSLTGPIFNVVDQEIRVLAVDERMIGRMNATMRTVIWAALPLGAMCGGMLADAAGISVTILAGGLIGISSAAWLLIARPLPSTAVSLEVRSAGEDVWLGVRARESATRSRRSA